MATIILEHSDLTGSGRLGEVLRDYGHRLEVRRLHAGDAVPTDLQGVDAVVSCGGPHAPDDDSEWAEREIEFLRMASTAALPVVGICLGSQLLARALGGELEKQTISCGWHEVSLTPVGREDPVFMGMPWRSRQVLWHRYHVTTPPPGARVLASSERSPVQAWAVGLRTYGIQYHPEAYAETVERWADDEPEALEEAGITRDQLVQQADRYDATTARLAHRLFESMALVLMPVDRRYAGIAKDMHH
jgi:GMP synthase-like glutamine amidotransferase